jgi:hypothetical protein
MEMKLFSAVAATEIGKLEAEINQWLSSSLTADAEVKHISTALAANPMPYLVVTVWWDKR